MKKFMLCLTENLAFFLDSAVHNRMYSIKFKDFSFSHWETVMHVLKVQTNIAGITVVCSNSLTLRSAVVEEFLSLLHTIYCIAVALGVELLMYCAISKCGKLW